MALLRNKVQKRAEGEGKFALEDNTLSTADQPSKLSMSSQSLSHSNADIAIYGEVEPAAAASGGVAFGNLAAGHASRASKVDYEFIRSLLDPDNENEIKSEGAIEEFIVLKAIRDI
jgi:hypothetical protein